MRRGVCTSLFLLYFILVAYHRHCFKEDHNWFIVEFNNPDIKENGSFVYNFALTGSSPDTTSTSVTTFSNDNTRLVPVSEVPYLPPLNKSILYAGNVVAWSWGITLGDRLLRIGNSPITINIDASFQEEHYFVIPNVKGLCNRLQVFAGVYILSSYYRIRILLSKSMLWKRLWNLTELFPGQFIELPDSGTHYLNS